ncbi:MULTISPECIES: GNAT family N-acetyltransferase [unclassified Bifidobacterium]|nr:MULTISPECIES: GNAT family N-acetyltransferase [unclassified Bifidobacterium]TPF79075.1 GNAT family acetyltransferase [Bifidobacterium sp. UTCIF-1]TPF80946.1 GNAT family acetyltransferase [Bifidobacterium sp. UTCIF-24]TPF83257.1 GNAT family acetyltransferase [Bifidobacterium sp. UTCIF-3]TPF84982.1 GNAT family acetyltransferase [Bifidobacterium sp. UTCIF-36]TPF88987.1 GNAT family acetyltransferase [Bifidobacterium sp. UTBIF-56]
MSYTYMFRPAVESDLQAITDIYNASVIAGGSTADLTPRSLDQRRTWVESHQPPYGVFVVEASVAEDRGGMDDDANLEDSTDSEDGTGTGTAVVGFGALSVFYDRAGYDGVTDLAYYIDTDWQGRGAGTFLLEQLLDEARARHMRKACGIIFADNAGSIALMNRFGFTRFGLMPAAATDSTGTMRDMSYWYLDL